MTEEEKYNYYEAIYNQYTSQERLTTKMPEPYKDIYSVALYYFDKIFRDSLIEKLDNEHITSTIHTRLILDNNAYLYTHMAINQRMRKVYFEMDINNKLTELLDIKEEDLLEMEHLALKELMRFFRYTKHIHRFKLEVITPPDDSKFCCDIAQVLTCHTVGYWKSIYGKYSVLEDREQVKADLLVKGVGFDKTIFYSKVHELNLEYKPGDDNYFVIPDAFNAYKNMYEEELGIELPEVYEDYASISYTNINAGN